MVKTAMTQPKKLVIDRKRWLRGKGDGMGELYDLERKMCCLGFYARECGYTVKQIKGKGRPAELVIMFGDNGQGLDPLVETPRQAPEDSGLCVSMMHINDDKEISESEREEELTQHFKKIDVEVEFVGE